MADPTKQTSHFNKLSPAEAEALALLAEECAEVIKFIGKAFRHGLDSENPLDDNPPTNRMDIEHEAGDVLAAIQIAISLGILRGAKIDEHVSHKLNSINRWLHHIEVRTIGPGPAVRVAARPTNG